MLEDVSIRIESHASVRVPEPLGGLKRACRVCQEHAVSDVPETVEGNMRNPRAFYQRMKESADEVAFANCLVVLRTEDEPGGRWLRGLRIREHVEIGGGTHSIFKERNRMERFREVQFFLDDTFRWE